MSLETSIYSVLTGESSISALVSTRVYPVTAPDGADFPLIIYQKQSHDLGYSHSSGDDGIYTANYVFYFLGATYAAASALRDAVRTFLSGYEGTFGGNSVSLIRLETEDDDFDFETNLYTLRSEYRIDVNS